MTAKHIQNVAAFLCQRDRDVSYVQPPSCNIDAVFPPLSMSEYEELELDTAKYWLYYSAIRKAMHRIIEEGARSVKILVLGCGFGRLVTLALDASRTSFAERGLMLEGSIEVHACDANETAVCFCRKQFAENPAVRIHDPFCMVTPGCVKLWPKSIQDKRGCFHLIVSEVLGSFGDSEFLPEISFAAMASFAKPEGAIMIPREWSTYVVPIYSDELNNHFVDNQDGHEAMHVMGMPPDVRLLAPCVEAYRGSCDSEFLASRAAEGFNTDVDLRFEIDAPASPGNNPADSSATVDVTGVAGYFTALLWSDTDGDIMIDTRHHSPLFNTFHWEAFLFPLRRIEHGAFAGGRRALRFCLRRRCKLECRGELNRYRLWYEWAAGSDSEWMNSNGHRHSLYLCEGFSTRAATVPPTGSRQSAPT